MNNSVDFQPDSKTGKRVLSTLTTHFAYLSKDGRTGQRQTKAKGSKEDSSAEVAGEYATLMEQEVFDFVLFEVPSVV